MKAFKCALTLAAAMGLPGGAVAAQVDFGSEFEVNGYSVNHDTGGDDEQVAGLQQRILLNANMKGAGGVSLHTGVLLSGNTWEGDEHDDNAVSGATDDGGGGDDVRLDHGYIQVPMLGGVLRAGRMKSDWNSCFLACDDRRDRIQYMQRFGTTSVFGLYDKRVEGALEYPEDDEDQWLLGFIGNYSGWTVGSLFMYFDGDANEDGYGAGAGPRTDVKLISPYVKGKAGPIAIEAGMNYATGGSEDAGAYFQETGTSEYLRLGWSSGPMKFEGQVVGVQNGGLVDNGFDTYSSLIGNSPAHDQSPTNVANLGSGGVAGASDELTQMLYALRVTGNITDQWKIIGAVGGFNYENTSDAADPFDVEGSGTFLDAQVHYQVTENTSLSATYGMLSGDDLQDGMFEFDNTGTPVDPGAGEDSADPSAMSLNINATF